MKKLLLIIAFALACGLHAKAQVINSRFLEENNGYLQWNDGERLSFEEASSLLSQEDYNLYTRTSKTYRICNYILWSSIGVDVVLFSGLGLNNRNIKDYTKGEIIAVSGSLALTVGSLIASYISDKSLARIANQYNLRITSSENGIAIVIDL